MTQWKPPQFDVGTLEELHTRKQTVGIGACAKAREAKLQPLRDVLALAKKPRARRRSDA